MIPNLAIIFPTAEQMGGSFNEVLHKIAKLGFVGVEFGQFHDNNLKTTRKILNDLGLQYVATHLDSLPRPENLNEILDREEELGNKTVIIPYWGELRSQDAINKMVDEFNQCMPFIKQRGMRMGFHNHCEEFIYKVDGKTAYQLFFEKVDPSVFAEVDLYWTQTAGEDPASVLRFLGKRAPLLHLKDGPCMTDQPMVALGRGKLETERILRGNDAEWHIVELDCCATSMSEAIKESYDFLTTNGLSKGMPQANLLLSV